MNTIFWDPSSDLDVVSYEVQRADAAAGPFTALATVAHAIPGADYTAGPPAQFFYADATGTLSTWYRLRVIDSLAQASAWCDPFQVGQTSAALSTTALDIVQMALAEVGETTTVASLTSPTTKGERLGALFYERVRDRTMRKVSPAWATRRASLVLLTDHVREGWGYCYALPTDLLRIIDIDLGYRGDNPLGAAARPRWAREANNTATGYILCCDVEDAQLVYLAQVVDPTLWSPDFREAVLWGLAAKLVMPLAVKPDMAARAEQMARTTLLEAAADDLNEGRPDPTPESDIIAARSW